MKLDTKRLILRKPKKSDWKDVLEGVGEFDIAKNTSTIPHPYTRKDAEEFLGKKIVDWEKKDYLFLIELKSEKKVIGAMGLHKVDKFVGTSETGSWINKKYQGKGYITEAKIAANEFAFNKLKLRRLTSPVFKDNNASKATQLRMGYKLEGMLRKDARSLATGKIHDVNIYGLLKVDWKRNLSKLKKHLEKKLK